MSQTLKLMAPRALALGAGQVTFIVATSLASGLDPGSVTAFTLAFTVFSIPLSVIGVPLGIVALPTLSRDLARGAIDEFVELVTRALRMIAFVIGPIVALGSGPARARHDDPVQPRPVLGGRRPASSRRPSPCCCSRSRARP